MNWLLIGVGILFFICMVIGYIRGFIKIIVSFGTTVASVVLVIFLTPYTSKAIVALTPIDEMVQKKCISMMSVEGIDQNISEKFLNKIELPRQKQIEILEKADIPEFVKQGLIENNNNEAYKQLGVENFVDYIGAYVSGVVVKIISFLLTFLIVIIFIRAIIFALDVIAALPVLNGLNRIAGMFVGGLIAIIFTWLVFLALTLLYDSYIGVEGFRCIESSKLLTFLYEKNVILDWVTKLR
ncbi:CvpA family protein [Faecalimonas sp.]